MAYWDALSYGQDKYWVNFTVHMTVHMNHWFWIWESEGEY